MLTGGKESDFQIK